MKPARQHVGSSSSRAPVRPAVRSSPSTGSTRAILPSLGTQQPKQLAETHNLSCSAVKRRQTTCGIAAAAAQVRGCVGGSQRPKGERSTPHTHKRCCSGQHTCSQPLVLKLQVLHALPPLPVTAAAAATAVQPPGHSISRSPPAAGRGSGHAAAACDAPRPAAGRSRQPCSCAAAALWPWPAGACSSRGLPR